MRVFTFSFDDYPEATAKCPECGWETSLGYVLARNKEEAEKELKEGYFLCGSCLAEELAVGNYNVSKEFDPDDYEDLVFVQWLDKEDVEYYLGKKITEEEFKEMRKRFGIEPAEYLADYLHDYIPYIYEKIKKDRV